MKLVFIEKCQPVHSILKAQNKTSASEVKTGFRLVKLQFKHLYVLSSTTAKLWACFPP